MDIHKCKRHYNRKHMQSKEGYARRIFDVLVKSAEKAARKRALDKGLTVEGLRRRLGGGSPNYVLEALNTLIKAGVVEPPTNYRLRAKGGAILFGRQIVTYRGPRRGFALQGQKITRKKKTKTL